MTDCVLIHPGDQRTIYGALADTETAIETPTWARMIAGWLRDRNYSVAIIDQEAEDLTPEQVAERVSELSPRIVAIVVFGHQPSASTQQMVGATDVAKAIPQTTPKLMIGNHVSALPEHTIRELHDCITFVCDGEGPLTIDAWLRYEEQRNIPGAVWRKGGLGIYGNPTAPLIPIDELHGDAWDLLPMDRYRAHTWQCLDGSPRQPYASIYTSLGCPYRCSFCMINVFQHVNKYRMRKPIHVLQQIERLYYDYGVRTLKIADEMFVLNPRHYLGICELLASRPSMAEHLNIWAYARVDTIRPRTLAVMRQAGIRWLALGIESGSAHVRDGAEKSLTNDDIRASVRAIQDAGINVLGNFIFGLPDDTIETMWSTLMLAKSLDLDWANFYSAMAYPGSRLHDEVDPSVLPKSWSGYSQHSVDCTPLPTATLSSKDVLRFRDEAHHEFFESDGYLEHIDKKFGSAAVDTVRRMTSVKLERAA